MALKDRCGGPMRESMALMVYRAWRDLRKWDLLCLVDLGLYEWLIGNNSFMG